LTPKRSLLKRRLVEKRCENDARSDAWGESHDCRIRKLAIAATLCWGASIRQSSRENAGIDEEFCREPGCSSNSREKHGALGVDGQKLSFHSQGTAVPEPRDYMVLSKRVPSRSGDLTGWVI